MEETVKQPSSLKFAGKLQDYKLLIKFNLSFMVVFSALISYLLAPKVKEFDCGEIGLFFIGGMLVTGSANAINQIVEKDTDALMKRTANRPGGSGRMGTGEAWTFAVLAGVGGVLILSHFNWLAAGLAAFSLFIYAFIYTPLKKVSSISVLVGAVPGSLPCLIGWAAGNDDLSTGGWILFAIQFFWQFPHFWAIAWIAHKDYAAAGFKLLPSNEGPTRYSAIQAIIYSLLLVPVGVLPYFFGGDNGGMSGIIALLIVAIANLGMVAQCVRLYREMTVKAARRVMFSSYIYLPVVLLALLANKA